jgi:hypothetical protein
MQIATMGEAFANIGNRSDSIEKMTTFFSVAVSGVFSLN